MKRSSSTRPRLALVALVVIALVIGYILGQLPFLQRPPETTTPAVPSVKGFYKGQEILFIHTEASDPQVVSMLSMMMGSPVIHVPNLGQVPGALLGDVYVFANGVKGDGPFGFQSDVFSSVPGDREYTPLRAVGIVSWRQGAAPRELRSVDEIKAAEANGDVSISPPDVVVNMPIVKWPGGQR